MEERTGAVILAAGISGISKSAMLRQELDTLREAGISPIAVVTGFEEEEVRRELAHRKVIFVENPDYRRTRMFRSIQLGLEALAGKCSRALIVNGDAPSFSADTVRALAEADHELTFPVHGGKPGHPFCLDMGLREKILSYEGRKGIQGMMRKGLIQAGLIEVDDPGIHMEAKEEESLAEVIRYQQETLRSRPIRPEVKLSLARSEGFFDEELAELLREIDQCHSLNTACKNRNMAYSRGWKMLKRAEEMLGVALITKQVGGARGGGSVLTEEGREKLQAYEELRRKVIAFAEKEAKRLF